MSRASAARGLVSRRHVLLGAGVALTLPWLESLAGREARAQAAPANVRFLPIFLPNGAPDFWKPASVGAGPQWALSSVLEPLQALKPNVTVLSGLENGSVFNPNGSPVVEPAHSLQAGAWLTCSDARAVRQRLAVADANGVSVDQLLVRHAKRATPLPSLQVGLSTTRSACDSQPCSLTRSVSWSSETLPMYKLVDPQKIFEKLTSVISDEGRSEEAKKRARARRRVVDAVSDSAKGLRPKLSMHDQQRMDEFLDSVNRLQFQVTQPLADCALRERPVFTDLRENANYLRNTAEYSKSAHADVMNDLIVMAFQCNATHVISYMLEDENSEFTYDHVAKRSFTPSSSAPGDGVCGAYASAQHGDVDEFASITWWNVGKVADLCLKLSQVVEEEGRSLLDNTVVFLGSGTHGSNHACSELPAVLIGSGGGKLRTDAHLDLGNRPLRDLYGTLLGHVFESEMTEVGSSATGSGPPSPIFELLA